MAVIAAELYRRASAHQPVRNTLWVTGGMNLLMAAFWIFLIKPAWVMRAAQLYADRLMEALDAM